MVTDPFLCIGIVIADPYPFPDTDTNPPFVIRSFADPDLDPILACVPYTDPDTDWIAYQ